MGCEGALGFLFEEAEVRFELCAHGAHVEVLRVVVRRFVFVFVAVVVRFGSLPDGTMRHGTHWCLWGDRRYGRGIRNGVTNAKR